MAADDSNPPELADEPPTVEQQVAAAERALADVDDITALDEWHREHIGRSGHITKLRRLVGSVAPDARADFGRRVNEAADTLTRRHDELRDQLLAIQRSDEARARAVDVTMPPRHTRRGRLHPVTATMREVCGVFEDMGFSIFDTPHVELDELNFQLLNIPPHHPARDMQDTFYVSDSIVLRTHTSAGQIRAMRHFAPGPVRVVLPGLCYRNEDVTPRSEMQFHQVEGVLVGPNIQMSDLKGVLSLFARRIFGADQAIRFRGSYFPFTEPSVEVDVKCTVCAGLGCRMCKQTGWLELLGAGLMHPDVLRNGGYDPDRVRGIAFGLGIERIVLLRHEMSDIRHFFKNDLRVLSQFS